MRYRQTAGLRLRPVPELGTCLAFTPSPPRLHTLNPAAWLIAELCGGPAAAVEAGDVESEFLRRTVSVASRADADRQFRDGIRQLSETGIIHLSET